MDRWVSVIICDLNLLLTIVRYALNEDPKILLNIRLEVADVPSHVTLSPDSLVMAIAINRSILIYSSMTGTLLEQLNNVHNGIINI